MVRTRCTAGGRPSPRLPPMAVDRAATAVEATLVLCRAGPLSKTLPTSPHRLHSSISLLTLLSSISLPTLLSSTRLLILQATLRLHRLTDMGKLSLEDTCPKNTRNARLSGVTRAPADGKMNAMFQPSVVIPSPHRPPPRARSSSVP